MCFKGIPRAADLFANIRNGGKDWAVVGQKVGRPCIQYARGGYLPVFFSSGQNVVDGVF